jgi:hypothetical protein
VLNIDDPELGMDVDYLHFWANNGEFTQCVIAHLEQADVRAAPGRAPPCQEHTLLHISPMALLVLLLSAPPSSLHVQSH